MTRFILVRHGQTEWNADERVRGQMDIALDSTGLAQAEATAQRLVAEWKPAAVYCSPLRRAVQTAQAAAVKLGQEPQLVPEFTDMSFGAWQGLRAHEIEEGWPELAHAWMRAPHTVTFPGGESLDGVRERAMPALRLLIERHAGEEIVIVAHTVVNRVLLCAVIGIDNSNYWRIGQDTCAINVIDWQGGQFIIQSLNDTSHLRPNSPYIRGLAL